MSAKKYLLDIHLGPNARRATAMLRAAVERPCEIIGEALAKLAKVDESIATRITEHRRITAFPNILIHGYAEVDLRNS